MAGSTGEGAAARGDAPRIAFKGLDRAAEASGVPSGCPSEQPPRAWLVCSRPEYNAAVGTLQAAPTLAPAQLAWRRVHRCEGAACAGPTPRGYRPNRTDSATEDF